MEATAEEIERPTRQRVAGAPPVALTVGIVMLLVRRFNATGAQWTIFVAGIVVLLVLAVLVAVYGPRWQRR